MTDIIIIYKGIISSNLTDKNIFKNHELKIMQNINFNEYTFNIFSDKKYFKVIKSPDIIQRIKIKFNEKIIIKYNDLNNIINIPKNINDNNDLYYCLLIGILDEHTQNIYVINNLKII